MSCAELPTPLRDKIVFAFGEAIYKGSAVRVGCFSDEVKTLDVTYTGELNDGSLVNQQLESPDVVGIR